VPERAPIKVVGWGFLRLPGEKKRRERAEREARELLRLADAVGRRSKDLADRAIAEVREALSQFSSGPHGDLLCGADRAAVVAVAALRDAGLLSGDTSSRLSEESSDE
jgi:hypothetical protein